MNKILTLFFVTAILIMLTWLVIPTVFYMIFSLMKYGIGFIVGYTTHTLLTKFKTAHGTDDD